MRNRVVRHAQAIPHPALATIARPALAAALSIVVLGCGLGTPSVEGADPSTAAGAPSTPPIALGGPIAPLPERGPDLDPARVALGRQLFFDPILSPPDRPPVICNDCHDLSRAGTDGRVRSRLPGRPDGGINVPTVFNLAYVFRYSWSGRFDRMADILTVAMTSPAAMGTTWEDAAARLAGSAEHRDAFERVYPDGPTAANLENALETFVLSLRTPDAPFDRYVRGDASAIDDDAREGYELFREYGCASCHQGVNVGGNMYQRFGVMRDYFADRGGVLDPDRGLYNGTQREEDMHVFRVPSLRNVALTAPYFHDGSAATLEQAVATMARYQLGRPLSGEQVSRLVAFLRSLTGSLAEAGAPG